MKKLLLLLGFITLITTGLANTNSTSVTKVAPAATPATTTTPNDLTTKEKELCKELKHINANPSKDFTPHIKAANERLAKDLGC